MGKGRLDSSLQHVSRAKVPRYVNARCAWEMPDMKAAQAPQGKVYSHKTNGHSPAWKVSRVEGSCSCGKCTVKMGRCELGSREHHPENTLGPA